ncbi:MAG: cob(I)yrinic acid a,c-diamide adenosyltransferase [Candidatus Woesearchaeota archaeon]|nr:cob(I)yrinic acid a,c-diamide adenosyltransferase [Candidatus Woesearchaeota archaeon]
MNPPKARIYTRTGDVGTTSFLGGTRVFKDDLRIEVCGSFDELNSVLGVVRGLLGAGFLFQAVEQVQHDLFTVCAELATNTENFSVVPRVLPLHVLRLEQWIDGLEEQLPEQTSFILPGGSPAGGFLHVARAVCRRAERCLVQLSKTQNIRPEVLQYVNRLSDLLFIMARFANKDYKEQAPEYQKEKG